MTHYGQQTRMTNINPQSRACFIEQQLNVSTGLDSKKGVKSDVHIHCLRQPKLCEQRVPFDPDARLTLWFRYALIELCNDDDAGRGVIPASQSTYPGFCEVGCNQQPTRLSLHHLPGWQRLRLIIYAERTDGRSRHRTKRVLKAWHKHVRRLRV